MSRSRCTCGSQVRWKADEADSDELLIARLSGLSGGQTLESFMTGPISAAQCSSCGHLWIGWGDGEEPAEYLPAKAAGTVS
jgi:hypothetical protein